MKKATPAAAQKPVGQATGAVKKPVASAQKTAGKLPNSLSIKYEECSVEPLVTNL